MNWIKKNPAPTALALVSVASIALAGMLYSKVSEFPNAFDTSKPVENNKIEPADLTKFEEAAKAAAATANWRPEDNKGRLFVSTKYIEKDGKLIDVENSTFPMHPPVSNEWLLKYKLPITSATVLADDTDGDGFSNLDEWNGMDAKSHLQAAGSALQSVTDTNGNVLPSDSTDPTDPKSHPAHLTKLRLIDIKQVPFRLILKSYDGTAANKAEMTFFVNTVDRGGRTALLKIGEQIPVDKRYKLTDFRPKSEKGGDGTETDKSELVIINTEYNEELALPVNQTVDSPESYAVFSYKWVAPGAQPTPDFGVKKNGEFTLQPETDKKYKLLKFGTGAVEIQTPAGDKVSIPLTK